MRRPPRQGARDSAAAYGSSKVVRAMVEMVSATANAERCSRIDMPSITSEVNMDELEQMDTWFSLRIHTISFGGRSGVMRRHLTEGVR